MSEEKLFKTLEKMSDIDIKVVLNGIIVYLEKSRNIPFKEIIKDCKELHRAKNRRFKK